MNIEKWVIYEDHNGSIMLSGFVYNSPTHTNGEYIHAGPIQTMDFKNKKARTKSFELELGEKSK